MRWLAHKLAKMRGWVFLGTIPPVPKMIIIGAPHTTNWDFIVFLAALHHHQIDVRFLAKHTLFRWPLGRFFRAFGGIPVDRSRAGGVVGQVTDVFDSSEEMILVITPEGTRSAARWWKSGFLSIAETARVPVVLAGVDYPSRTLTIGPAIEYEGDVTAFMDQAREFYADKRGLNPELEGPVVLREESGRS